MIEMVGVLNVSPESVQQDTVRTTEQEILLQAQNLIDKGCTIIDVGGRSSSNRKALLSDVDEYQRLLPVLKLLHPKYTISIDTWSHDNAIKLCGFASYLNYTSSEYSPELWKALAQQNTGVVINHMPYKNAYEMDFVEPIPYSVEEAHLFLEEHTNTAKQFGVENIIIDPNLGIWHPNTKPDYKKRCEDVMIAHLDKFNEIAPVMMIAPRTNGVLNISLCERIIAKNISYLRTHDPEKLRKLLYHV